MKFTNTTSSLLLASMALSPSLVSGAPTGMDTSTCPNPAGSPSVHQLPFSPRNDVGSPHDLEMRHAPAFRTGPGSPRRNLKRMPKTDKREESPLDSIIDPVTGLLKPVTGLLKPVISPLSGLLKPVIDPLTGLPIAGGLVSKVGAGLGLTGVNTKDEATGSVESASSNIPWSQIPVGSPEGLGGLSGIENRLRPVEGIIGDIPQLPGLAGGLGRSPPFSVIGRTRDGLIVVVDAHGQVHEISPWAAAGGGFSTSSVHAQSEGAKSPSSNTSPGKQGEAASAAVSSTPGNSPGVAHTSSSSGTSIQDVDGVLKTGPDAKAPHAAATSPTNAAG